MVEYATEMLAQYRVVAAPDARHLRQVTEERLFATRYQSPQPFLDTLEAVARQPALRLAPYQPRRKLAARVDRQLPLFDVAEA